MKDDDSKIKKILEQEFEKRHVSALLDNFLKSKRGYQEGNWETSVSKAGKFVEAVSKALLKYCGKQIPAQRNFKASIILRGLEQELKTIDDSIRIVIPKASIFVYEIANNRGARHDPDLVDPNEIDAGVVDVTISWILGELIRFSSKKNKNPTEARGLIEALTGKTFPFFEEIDDRFYVNINGLSATDVAMLVLYGRYPRRTEEEYLIDLVKRHNFSKNNANTAISRIRKYCDLNIDGYKLRGNGRIKAEYILDTSKKNAKT